MAISANTPAQVSFDQWVCNIRVEDDNSQLKTTMPKGAVLQTDWPWANRNASSRDLI